jgi:hypothetical protein
MPSKKRRQSEASETGPSSSHKNENRSDKYSDSVAVAALRAVLNEPRSDEPPRFEAVPNKGKNNNAKRFRVDSSDSAAGIIFSSLCASVNMLANLLGHQASGSPFQTCTPCCVPQNESWILQATCKAWCHN